MGTSGGMTARALLALAMVALFGGVVAGCGGGSAGASALCKDYAKLQSVSGTDTATLKNAASLYRKLAGEAPAEAKADLNTLADDEDKVANGDPLSVDNSAASAAADRVDGVLNGKCGGNQQTTQTTASSSDQSSPDTSGGNNSGSAFCSDVQTSLTVGGDNPGLRGPDDSTLQAAADLFHKVANETPSDAPGSIKDDLNLLADIEIKVKNGTDSNLDADAAQAAADRVNSYASTQCQQTTQPTGLGITEPSDTSGGSTASTSGGSTDPAVETFCTEYANLQTYSQSANHTDPSFKQNEVDRWLTMANDAPAEIKSDVQLHAHQLEIVAVRPGTLAPADALAGARAFTNVLTFQAQNCGTTSP